MSFIVGAVSAALAWVLLAPAFGADVFTRQNFRGRDLPTGAGVVIVLVILAALTALTISEPLGASPDERLEVSMRLLTFAALGFGLLGLLDDLGGAGESGGFAGHLKALSQGRLTTGAVKLFAGAGLAVVLAAEVHLPDEGAAGTARLVADGALIALTANLANLFDRAPGRVTKVSLLAFAGLIVAVGAEPELAGVALVAGAGAGLLLPDLRERMMLGDSGANVLGAALGVGVVIACAPGVRTGVLVAVLALNLISEWVSFTKVINSVTPLRAADRFGRLPVESD